MPPAGRNENLVVEITTAPTFRTHAHLHSQFVGYESATATWILFKQ